VKRALILALPLLIAGCGGPPVFELVYYGIQGVSLATSGRSVGDHAISAMMDQDCVVFRIVKGDSICHDAEEDDIPVSVSIARALKGDGPASDDLSDSDDPVLGEDNEDLPQTIVAEAPRGDQPPAPTVAAALLDPMIVPQSMSDDVSALAGVAAVETVSMPQTTAFSPPSLRQIAVAVEKQPLPAPVSVVALPPPPQLTGWEAAVAVAKHTDRMRSDRGGDRVMVLGSFLTKPRALRAARQWPAFSTTVVSAEVRGRTYYRVVTGPFKLAGIGEQRDRLKSHGVSAFWTAKICPAGLSRPQCVALPTG
jgi:hypothetical protein